VNDILELSLVFEHIVVNSDDKNLVKLNGRTIIIVKCKVKTLERSSGYILEVIIVQTTSNDHCSF